jgi:hypothetical protein
VIKPHIVGLFHLSLERILCGIRVLPLRNTLEFAMAEIDKPSEKEFAEGAFSTAPDKHRLATGILAAALWRLLRR